MVLQFTGGDSKKERLFYDFMLTHFVIIKSRVTPQDQESATPRCLFAYYRFLLLQVTGH